MRRAIATFFAAWCGAALSSAMGFGILGIAAGTFAAGTIVWLCWWDERR